MLAAVTAATVLFAVPASATPQQRAKSVHNAYAAGVYAGPGNVAGIAAFESKVGKPVEYAMDFINGSSWATIANPAASLSPWYGSGFSMIWGVPIIPNNSHASLAKGATGAYDQYYLGLAQGLVSAGQGSSIIRIGWEFNGKWFPWSAAGHAAQFVRYWRHIVTTMRSVPGAHFKFEWNPSRGDNGAGNLAVYYPGNAYVDYVGLDVFDVEWQQYPGASAEFENMQTQPYGLNWLASFSALRHKPMVFPEWGLGWGTSARRAAPVSGSAAVSGGDNATFVNDMSRWFATHNVFEATYWDYGSSALTPHNRLATVALRRNAALRT